MPSASGGDAWIGEVVDFWFRELPREAWFRKDTTVDRTIRDRFLALYDKLAVCTADDLSASADKALAAVIVLDQFPRNMFRDSAKAFATDGLALSIANAAVAHGLRSRTALIKSCRASGASSFICLSSTARRSPIRCAVSNLPKSWAMRSMRVMRASITT